VRPWFSVALVMLCGRSALAQEPPYFSANQLSQPARTDGFVALESSRRMFERFQTGGRVSYLNGPLSLRLAAPSETPTSTRAVDHLLLVEAAFAVRPWEALDLGVVLPWHAYQSGTGTGAVTGGRELEPTALSDIRLSAGYSLEWDEISLRPFLIAHLPTGNASQFAGEGAFHGELGFALGRSTPDFEVTLDFRTHLRESRTISLYRLSSQLRIALGGRFRLTSLTWLGLEAYLSPYLEGQPTPDAGQPAFALPAEVLASLGLELDRWLVGVGAGVGLPLGHLSSINGEKGGILAPSTPAFRTLLDIRYQFEIR
jgi:hypothetical protein